MPFAGEIGLRRETFGGLLGQNIVLKTLAQVFVVRRSEACWDQRIAGTNAICLRRETFGGLLGHRQARRRLRGSLRRETFGGLLGHDFSRRSPNARSSV